MRTTKGFRAETRRKLKADLREKFKPEPFLRQFEPGEKVVIDPYPLSQKGMPWPKFKGMVGEVQEKRGRAYVVKIKVGGKEKYIISRPEHLRRL